MAGAAAMALSASGYQEPLCRFRRIFLNLRNYATELLDRSTLSDVAKGLPVAEPEVLAPGFTAGDRI